MRVPIRNVVFAVAPVLFAATALAGPVPVYDATSATVTFINSYLGSGLGDMFTFSGPLTNGSGGGATAVAYSNLPALNAPFGFSQQIIIDDTGNEAGAAFGNGTDYPSVQYTGGGGAVVTASSPITLTAGNLTVSVPATLTGALDVCSPDNFCSMGGGPFSNVFDVDMNLSGTLTVTFAQFNFGSTYTLTNAEFTTSAPEPGTWVMALGGLLLVGLSALLRKRMYKEG